MNADTERDWLEGNDARTQHEREIEARTMSDPADDAWQKWTRSINVAFPSGHAMAHAAFLAGYRRALQDAADAIEGNADSWEITENVKPDVRGVVSNVLWGTAKALRDRAVGVTGDTGEEKR